MLLGRVLERVVAESALVDEHELALEASLGEGAATALERAAATAREAAENTKGMLAMRGRASYTGERSRDTYDAGSVAIAVMAEKLVELWAE